MHTPADHFGSGVDELLAGFRGGAFDIVEMLRRFSAERGIPDIEPQRWRERCYALVDELVRPMPGARETIALLRERGVPLAILTNGWSPLQQMKIARALGADAIDIVLVSDEIGSEKPSAGLIAFDAPRRSACGRTASDVVRLGRSGVSARSAAAVRDHPRPAGARGAHRERVFPITLMGTLTITGGTLRSRRVPTPPGRAVRPTPSRVKEALFSILGARVETARVLDLFAGSGALGFEALSRGAAGVTFVERHRPTADALRAVARTLGVDDQINTGQHPDVWATCHRLADAVKRWWPEPDALFAALRERGAIDATTTVVYEHAARNAAPDDPAMRLERGARYGDVALAFLRPVEAAA